MTDDTSPVATAATAPAQAQEWARALAGKRLLVTGAAGFIGGALLRRLRDYACDVTATVLHPHEAEAIRDQGGKAEVLDLVGDAPFDPHVRDVDIVFHLAALFQETGHREAMYRMVNETGALRLCQAAAAAGVGASFIAARSACMATSRRFPARRPARSIRWIGISAPS